MAQSVFAACKSLKIRTVAEGVETKEQADILKEMGCDMIQGYYINKPLPGDCFKETCLSFRTYKNKSSFKVSQNIKSCGILN